MYIGSFIPPSYVPSSPSFRLSPPLWYTHPLTHTFSLDPLSTRAYHLVFNPPHLARARKAILVAPLSTPLRPCGSASSLRHYDFLRAFSTFGNVTPTTPSCALGSLERRALVLYFLSLSFPDELTRGLYVYIIVVQNLNDAHPFIFRSRGFKVVFNSKLYELHIQSFPTESYIYRTDMGLISVFANSETHILQQEQALRAEQHFLRQISRRHRLTREWEAKMSLRPLTRTREEPPPHLLWPLFPDGLN